MQQGAVVGQQQQAGGVLVEPPDRRNRRIAPAPAFGQQRKDQGAGFLARAGDAQRLVHHQHDAGRRIEFFVVHAEPRGKRRVERDSPFDVAENLAVETDATGAGEHKNLAPRAIAEIGEQAVEADGFPAHLTASITLKPPSPATGVNERKFFASAAS